MILGIDIGSSATKAVLLDETLGLLGYWERPNRGRPADAFRSVVDGIFEGSGGRIRALGITGAGREIIEATPGIFQPNEIVSLALGASRAYPETRSIIEIGAQTSRWVLFDRAPKDVWKNKGNLRIWFCKEGPYRNQMLRMKIKFCWYLSLLFDLQRPV